MRKLPLSALALVATALPFSGALAQKSMLTQHVPKIVQSGAARKLQALDKTQKLTLVVSLPLRNQAEMEGLMADIYNPQSPNFHHWLTSAEFDARFGPTQSDYAAVKQWFRTQGFTSVSGSSNFRILTFSATVDTINKALHIEESMYHDSDLNRDFIAPDQEPTLDLAVPLLAISGLDTSHPKVSHLKRDPALSTTTGVKSDSTTGTGVLKGSPVKAVGPTAHRTGSDPSGYFTPYDMRQVYYGTGPLTGNGLTAAIFSFDGYLPADLTKYYSSAGSTGSYGSTVPVQNVLTNGFDGGCELYDPCDDGEQILDIVQMQGMAPSLSKIYFYEGTSAVATLNQFVSDNNASLMSSSWGGGDFGPATTPMFQQMALQGQTFLNATGDDGGFNNSTYLPPSLDPNITQVGGTDLTTTGPGGTWVAETAWAYSGGGYFDPGIQIPDWQRTAGVITASNAGSTSMRNSPDIAAEANYDNCTVVNGAYECGYGGTSFAAPRLGGYLMLANEQLALNGKTPRLGFINPQLYAYGLRTNASSIYHDVTSGSAPSTSLPVATYSAVAGYDLVTGWGAPNGQGLIGALTGGDFSLTPSATSVMLVRGSSTTVAITINRTNGFNGTPTFAASNLPAETTATFSSIDANHVQMTLSAPAGGTRGASMVTITGTSGAITATTNVLVTQEKRVADDFTLTASDATAKQLGSGASTVTIGYGSGVSAPVMLTYSGLPTGVTASFDTTSTRTGAALTFTPSIASTPGTYTVTVNGTAGGNLSHSTTLTLTITAAPSVLVNGGFETVPGTSAPVAWSSGLSAVQCSRTCGNYPHSGDYFAWLSGYGSTHTDTIFQTFTLPSSGTPTLNLWLWIWTSETTTTAKNDTFKITVSNTSGTVLGTLATFSNLDKSSSYVLHSYDLSAYSGQTIVLTLTGQENASRQTSFFVDDVSVTVQ